MTTVNTHPNASKVQSTQTSPVKLVSQPFKNQQQSGQPNKAGSSSQQKRNFIQKGKGKFKGKPTFGKTPAPIRKPKNPVFSYTSVCCKLPATKPATSSAKAAPVSRGIGDETSPKAKKLQHGLGGWNCTGCKKPCKVTVKKFVEPTKEVVVPVAPEESAA